MRRQLSFPNCSMTISGSPAEVAASLVDLRHINDWFGGTRTTACVAAASRRRMAVSSQAFAAGGGCRSGRSARLGRLAFSPERGRELKITLLDRMWSHLPRNGTSSIAGDALALPFRDGAFDVVSCSLFAHHLRARRTCAIRGEAMRVCRRAVLINDLIRSPVASVAGVCGLPLISQQNHLA